MELVLNEPMRLTEYERKYLKTEEKSIGFKVYGTKQKKEEKKDKGE